MSSIDNHTYQGPHKPSTYRLPTGYYRGAGRGTERGEERNFIVPGNLERNIYTSIILYEKKIL